MKRRSKAARILHTNTNRHNDVFSLSQLLQPFLTCLVDSVTYFFSIFTLSWLSALPKLIAHSILFLYWLWLVVGLEWYIVVVLPAKIEVSESESQSLSLP